MKEITLISVKCKKQPLIYYPRGNWKLIGCWCFTFPKGSATPSNETIKWGRQFTQLTGTHQGLVKFSQTKHFHRYASNVSNNRLPNGNSLAPDATHNDSRTVVLCDRASSVLTSRSAWVNGHEPSS